MNLTSLSRTAALGLAVLAISSTIAGASMYALPPQDGASPEQSYVTANVNMRTGPGTNYPTKGRLVPGSFVDIIICQRAWCQVQAPARGDGWIARRYISEGVASNPRQASGGAPQTIPYGNDALPSAEMTAFETLNAQLGYRNARLEYDGGSCAVYVAIGPDGRPYRELLRNPDNTTICRP